MMVNAVVWQIDGVRKLNLAITSAMGCLSPSLVVGIDLAKGLQFSSKFFVPNIHRNITKPTWKVLDIYLWSLFLYFVRSLVVMAKESHWMDEELANSLDNKKPCSGLSLLKKTLFWNVGKLRVARPGCCPTPLSWWPLGLRTSAGHPSWFCPLLCSLLCSLLVGYSWFSYFRISQPLLPRNSTCPTVAGFVWKICLLLFRIHSPTSRWCWDLNDVTLS